MAVSTVIPTSLNTNVPSQADVVVVGLADSSAGPILVGVPDEISQSWTTRTGQSVMKTAISLGAQPKLGTTVLLAGPSGRLVVTGVGDVDVAPTAMRRAVANGVRRASQIEQDSPLHIAVSLDAVDPDTVQAAVEGALLAAYSYRKPGQTDVKVGEIALIAPEGDPITEAFNTGVTIAEAVMRARDWVNTPPNMLSPEIFADQAKTIGREARIDVEVLDEKALAKEGYGGILTVGGGSSRPPRLVRYSWNPRGASTHLVLVGKGITFDTGGLNLKTSEGMYTMKCDMAGAAAVLSATRAIADLKLKVRVTAYAPMAENMPSGTAYRPSDVLTIHGGTTVENANSDAEGRLVLADALDRANADKPDLVVDIATLTGACIVALGERTAGLMTSDDATADQLLEAAEDAGEAFWQLPIPQHLRDSLKSDVADLKSSGSRYGGTLSAAAFLQSFVAEGTRWAHLDIAGPAWSNEVYDDVPKGGTGMGVRTLVALARSLAN